MTRSCRPAVKRTAILICWCAFGLLQGPIHADEGIVIRADDLALDSPEILFCQIPLFSGWKYLSGDRPEWADPAFDDGLWNALDSLEIQLDPDMLSEADWTGVGWFRLHLRVDSDLWDRSLALVYFQAGACEIYLDGQLVHSLGKVGDSRETEEAYLVSVDNPEVIPIRFSKRADHVIAVRYSNFWAMDNEHLGFPVGIGLGFSEFVDGVEKKVTQVRRRTTYQVFFAVVPLAFTLLHVLFFLFYPQSRENLYYALFAGSISLLVIAPLQTSFLTGSRAFFVFVLIFKAALTFTVVFSMRFLYHIFLDAPPGFFKLVSAIGILMFLFSWFIPLNYYYYFALVAFLEMLRVVLIGICRKKEGALIIGAGCGAFILACTYQILMEIQYLEHDHSFTYVYGILALVVSMSVYLARNFARTSKDLAEQLNQVKELSERTLEQERQAREHERRAREEEMARKLVEADNALKAKELEEAHKRQRVLDELAETNRELQETQTHLIQSEKMASLGNLVAGIAHEINTPVGAINSMHDTLIRAVGKLKETLETTLSEAYNENRAMQASLKVIADANRVIATGTERVTGIVRSLRSFARLDEAELKEVDIHEGIDNTLMLVHHDVKNRIEVVKAYGDIPPIVCYPSRLNQVFLNLLVNASQAIEGEGEIGIRTVMVDEKVHIAIRDSGVGIPPENLGKVFDPGFTTKGVGTGLGLSICYQIVKDHRGEIEVESEVGEGTTFTVILPTVLDEGS